VAARRIPDESNGSEQGVSFASSIDGGLACSRCLPPAE
jgi:hypothetical protein